MSGRARLPDHVLEQLEQQRQQREQTFAQITRLADEARLSDPAALAAEFEALRLRANDPELAALVADAGAPLPELQPEPGEVAPDQVDELAENIFYEDGLPFGWPPGWPRVDPAEPIVTMPSRRRPWESPGEHVKRVARERSLTASARIRRVARTQRRNLPAYRGGAGRLRVHLDGGEPRFLTASGRQVTGFELDEQGRPRPMRLVAVPDHQPVAPQGSEGLRALTVATQGLTSAVRAIERLAGRKGPDIHVHVPPAEAPVVNIPAPQVHVTAAPSSPPRPVAIRVEVDPETGEKLFIPEELAD